MSYTKYGPFTDNGAPGISAEYENGVETFLSSINAAATDANITSNGNGGLSLVKVNLTNGSFSRMAVLGGSASQTITHNWGVNPDFVAVSYAGNFGTAPTHPLYWYTVDVNNVHVVGDSGYSWLALLIKE